MVLETSHAENKLPLKDFYAVLQFFRVIALLKWVSIFINFVLFISKSLSKQCRDSACKYFRPDVQGER